MKMAPGNRQVVGLAGETASDVQARQHLGQLAEDIEVCQGRLPPHAVEVPHMRGALHGCEHRMRPTDRDAAIGVAGGHIECRRRLAHQLHDHVPIEEDLVILDLSAETAPVGQRRCIAKGNADLLENPHGSVVNALEFLWGEHLEGLESPPQRWKSTLRAFVLACLDTLFPTASASARRFRHSPSPICQRHRGIATPPGGLSLGR